MDDSIIGVFLLIFCISIAALILWKLFDITRNSINNSKVSYDEEQFEKLAKAFIQYRKDTDKRLENIEAILTEEKAGRAPLNQPGESQPIEASDFSINKQNTSGTENKRRTQ